MTDRINMPTRRALEIVLSRVKMSRHTSEDLLHQLDAIRTQEPDEPVSLGPDKLYPRLLQIHSHVNVNESYTKAQMMSRFTLVRHEVLKMMGEIKP